MMNKFLNHRWKYVIVFSKRSLNIQSDRDLSTRMKFLNDNKKFKQALELFDKYEKNNNGAFSNLTITQALKASAQIGDFQRGKTLHHLISSRLLTDSYLLVSLIHFYMQCGDVRHAQSLFDTSKNKTLPMYGAMMKGYITNNLTIKAIQLFNEIKNPDEVIIILLFNACAQLANTEALNLTKKVYSQIPKSFQSNHRLLTSLIDALMKCGDPQYAQSLFDNISNRTIPMYGAMMNGYIENNNPNESINVFNKIKNPNDVIIILLFNACAQLGSVEALNLVKKVSSQIPKSFYSNSHLLTSQIDALMKCGDINAAQSLFDASKNRTLSMYGAMMKGYTLKNMANKAIELFNQLSNPSEVNVTLLFNACAQLANTEALNLTKKVYSQIPKSFQSNHRLLTSLIDALMKCGDPQYAQSLFDNISNKTIPMYGAMMNGYIENDNPNKVIEIFSEIKYPDEISVNIFLNACAQLGSTEALISAKNFLSKNEKFCYSTSRISINILDVFVKCGDYLNAELFFKNMKKNMKKTFIDYEILMNGYNKLKYPIRTLNLFNQMKIDQIESNQRIYLNLIKSLSQLGDYPLSQSIIKQIPNSILQDDQIKKALINMWGKTGCITKAKEIFDEISQRDRVVYTTMINSYGLNGMGIQAIETYRQMPSEQIDGITYICILNACSHSGLVEQAISIFKHIQMKTNKIYTTMIDCFSRAARFNEAEELIDEFERHYSPSSPMYMALLSGARNVNNIHLSENVYHRMKKIFPDQANPLMAAAILLANVYGSSGDIEKASNIRRQLELSGTKKKIGLTWTIINGKFFEFRAHDTSHYRSDEIYALLDKISQELVEHGHHYDSSWITRPLNQNETIASVLCGHSEKLAIACNFLLNPTATRIQLTKNLRICGDCHHAIKLIAKIRQCEIIVRDANRIHHFYTNGQCSCNDYF